MKEIPYPKLTPEQSADVVKWLHAFENRAKEEHGRHPNREVSLAKAALSAVHPIEFSKEFPAKPLLNFAEVRQGLDYIDNPPIQAAASSSEHDADLNAIEELVDKMGNSYHEARLMHFGGK